MPDIFDLFDLPPDLSPGLAEVLRAAICDALDAAKSSPCAKDQRGAAVYHPGYYGVVAASNGPPFPFRCDGSDACRFNCGKLAVHAEERALHVWTTAGGRRGMIVVHVHVVDGHPVPSGPPSCITCSRTMVELGVSQVWLWHATGWRSYSAVEFHKLSLQHEKHNLPVIMETR